MEGIRIGECEELSSEARADSGSEGIRVQEGEDTSGPELPPDVERGLKLIMGVRRKACSGVIYMEADGLPLRCLPLANVVFASDLVSLFNSLDPEAQAARNLDSLPTSDYITLRSLSDGSRWRRDEKLIFQEAALALSNEFFGAR